MASTLGPGFLLPGGLGSVPWKDVRGAVQGLRQTLTHMGFLEELACGGAFLQEKDTVCNTDFLFTLENQT